ncbi:histidine kinase [Vallitalea longa]|uniref:histidine kinase n=1 Tax=Vallitalea longa TaxID=2936439 RepID=A0A9W5YE02_9FIRM|nr:sensor histidine kinase [Vallitalea longa]GKX30800.1 histidine kinase [Vallitalea longa]
MNSKMIKIFFIDRIKLIIFYVLNTSLLINYFNLYQQKSRSIVYPIIVAAFLLIIYLVLDWLKFYQFMKIIMKDGKDFSVKDNYGKEQLEIIKYIKTNQSRHIRKIRTIISEYKQNIRFFSLCIHNMKASITVIKLIIERINKKTYDENEINLINHEINKIHYLSEMGLNMLRFGDFSKDVCPTKLNIVEEMKSIITENKNYFIINNIYPKLSYEKEYISIITDKKWNKVILQQIMSNAIKYSVLKHVDNNINISISEKKSYVEVKISDSGIGIPDYDLKRAFQPFFTGENGRLSPNSSGIGLYLCKKICDKLKHKIKIESKKDIGTTVYIYYYSDYD